MHHAVGCVLLSVCCFTLIVHIWKGWWRPLCGRAAVCVVYIDGDSFALHVGLHRQSVYVRLANVAVGETKM